MTCLIIYRAYVYVIGEDDVEKVLEFSGRSVGGFNIVVTEVLPHQPIMIDFSPESKLIWFLILFFWTHLALDFILATLNAFH